MENAWLEIGQVVTVDAARRSVRVKPAAGCLHEFESKDRFWLCAGSGAPICARIAGMHMMRGLVRVAFTPGLSRDMVEKLGHARVMIPKTLRASRPDGLPGLSEMTGLRIVLATGELLGDIIEVIETPAGGAVRLKMPDGRTAALPFTDAVFTGVDRDRGLVHVADPGPFLVIDDVSPDA